MTAGSSDAILSMRSYSFPVGSGKEWLVASMLVSSSSSSSSSRMGVSSDL